MLLWRKRLLQYLAELQILEIHSLLLAQPLRRPTNLIEFGWCDLGRGTSKLESSRKLPANATVSVRFTTKCGAPPGTNKVCRQLWQLAIGTLTTMMWWTIMKLNWNDTSSYSTGYGHVQHDAHFASIEYSTRLRVNRCKDSPCRCLALFKHNINPSGLWKSGSTNLASLSRWHTGPHEYGNTANKSLLHIVAKLIPHVCVRFLCDVFSPHLFARSWSSRKWGLLASLQALRWGRWP